MLPTLTFAPHCARYRANGAEDGRMTARGTRGTWFPGLASSTGNRGSGPASRSNHGRRLSIDLPWVVHWAHAGVARLGIAGGLITLPQPNAPPLRGHVRRCHNSPEAPGPTGMMPAHNLAQTRWPRTMNGVMITESVVIPPSDMAILGDPALEDTQLGLALRRISVETELDPQATIACFSSVF
jgi:hypothetical protein